ncbi:hypothetical protein ACLMJK_009570 [Lecanora helva]
MDTPSMLPPTDWTNNAYIVWALRVFIFLTLTLLIRNFCQCFHRGSEDVEVQDSTIYGLGIDYETVSLEAVEGLRPPPPRYDLHERFRFPRGHYEQFPAVNETMESSATPHNVFEPAEGGTFDLRDGAGSDNIKVTVNIRN